MKAHEETVGKLFQIDARYVAPLYQRPYVWDEEQWEGLWLALRWSAEQPVAEGRNARPYFLGAMVLEAVPTLTGHVVTHQIIDGQQRLLTLQLCLAAVRDLLEEFGLSQYGPSVTGMILNASPPAGPDERSKVAPTNKDQTPFARVMSAGSAAGVRKLLAAKDGDLGDGRLARAYLYFAEQLTAWLTEDNANAESRFDVFWTALKNRLQIVAVDLDDADDAQQIFETLNAIGVKLSPADLIKNQLLRSAQRQKLDAEKLYKHYWERFDEERGYWREEVRQGRLRRPRIDLFFQHYLTLRRAREILATNLFGEFREFASESGLSVEQMLEEIHAYASIYRHFEAGSPHSGFFRRLADLDTTTVLPLLLGVFHRYDEASPEVRAVLADIESYLLRRLVCGLTTKNYNRVVVSLIQKLRAADDFSPERIRELLLEQQGESARWPTDSEFEYGWLSEAIGRDKAARVRIVLERLENALHSSKTEVVQFTKPLTIDHLMPQHWETHWLLPATLTPLVAKRQRDTLVQTIGNLTLLTQELNSDVSNGPWQQKRPEIQKYSLLKLNEGWPETWDEEAIQQRGRRLFDYAKSVWSRPLGPHDGKLWAGPGVREAPAPAPENLSPAKSLELEFWTGFTAYCSEQGSSLPFRLPQARHWLSYRLGRGGFSVSLTLNTQRGYVGCELYIQREDAKELFELLRAQKSAIENELAAEQDWQPLPGRRACRIIQTLPADLGSRSLWPVYFAWCRERAEKFLKVFGSRVKALQIEPALE